MEDSDDSNHEDVWSPTLREDVFSNHDMMGFSWSSEPRLRNEHLPLPHPSFNSIRSQPFNNLHHHTNWPSFQSPHQHRGHSNSAAPKPSSSASSRHPSSTTPVNWNHSHLDLPNFPLQVSPVGEVSNSSGRPPPLLPPPPRRVTPARAPPRPTRFASEEIVSSPSSFAISSSEREDSPWPDTEDLSDFVDLTADSSPPGMPSASSRHRQPPSRTSRNTSSVPSNPAKRRKTEGSSYRGKKVDEIDLRDVDDDAGLSKILEQQRMATIQTQKEQASRPVKLSTLQCIICLENMKDLTATHCGHLFCHACLMEALIAGENQGSELGKGIPKCPVCRKKVVRPSDHHRRDNHNVVPLAMKLKTKAKVDKGKGKAVDGDKV